MTGKTCAGKLTGLQKSRRKFSRQSTVSPYLIYYPASYSNGVGRDDEELRDP